MAYKPRVVSAACLSILVWLAPAQALASPTEQLRTTIDGVIGKLRAAGDDKASVRGQIVDILRGRFDFVNMSRRVLGGEWKKISADEQSRFVELFSRMLMGIYIGQMEGYTNEKIEYVKEKIKGLRAVVETHIVLTDNKRIPLRYTMAEKDGKWSVYDIVIEGISLIRNYQTSYRAIAKKDGMAGLYAQMEAKLAKQSVKK